MNLNKILSFDWKGLNTLKVHPEEKKRFSDILKISNIKAGVMKEGIELGTSLQSLLEGYTAFELSPESRNTILKHIPAKYKDVISHHITHSFPAKDLSDIKQPKDVSVVGHVDDGEGVQALVVSIDGSTKRPDGGTYHITHSIDRSKGRKPVHSNSVISKIGYTKLDKPIKILVTPKHFP